MSGLSLANRLISGVLTLIFAIAFTFVFAEERQRGLAMMLAIPLAVCLIWYAYLRFMKSDSKPKARTEYTGMKTIVTVFSIVSIVIAIASYAIRSKIGGIFVILFLILIVIYEILDYAETVKQTETISNEVKA